MKKLIIVSAAVALVGAVFAEEAKKPAEAEKPAEPQQLEESDDAPIFWGFGNYGLYSGYQLYGSLVNSEPTMQGYLEGNFNLNFADIDFGYLGAGVWNNSDLTGKRHRSYRRAFNEFDYNVHYGRTFYFDEDRKWGIDYRTTFVWYYYPHMHCGGVHGNGKTDTTMDWNHSFALVNPYVVPFLDWVHEYHENKANLWQFGLKRDCGVTDRFTLTPSATFVVRSRRYNWCFPTAGFTEFHNGGLATMRLQLDANYKITDNFGLFAKVAYCQTIDNELRDAAEHGSGADYGQYKDFAWGGIGITVAF